MAKDDLWSEIDDLAARASEHYGDTRTGYILTQIACIGRMFKLRGIKMLYEAINLHCSTLLSDQFGLAINPKPVKKNSKPKNEPSS